MPLPGFISPRTLTPEDNDALASYTPSPTATVNDVYLGGGTVGQLTPMLARGVGRGAEVLGELRGNGPKMLDPAEANRRFGIEGELSFDKPVSESGAAYKERNKRDELYKRDVLARDSSSGPLSATGHFLLSLGGSIIDPASLALNFVPVVGEEKIVAQLGFAAKGAAATRGAAVAAGAARGSLQGLQGGALTEGLTYGVGHGMEGREYSLGDAALGVTAGFLGGSILGGAGGILAPVDRVAGSIRAEAARQGQDADTALRIAQIESKLDPNARNPSSHAAGVFQFIDSTWEAKGGGDKLDAGLNIRRGVELLGENRTALRARLGREPQGWELYLAHQQGAGGAEVLLKDPERNVVDALATLKGVDRAEAVKRVRLNGGKPEMTAGEFAQVWKSRFEGARPGEGSLVGEVDRSARADPPEPVDALPRAVAMLDDEARSGALARAVEDLAENRPVAVGELMEVESRRGGGARPALDEDPSSFGMSVPGRLFHADTAVTVRGTEIPVRYALVEARDLVTSHDGDLVRNPDYPEALQPRERDRAGSQARLMRMEAEFNPRRLLESPDAESGAPIVAPDGTVESGNGRVIVLARNAARASPVFEKYKAALAERFDVSGFEQPVLVRIRTEPLAGADRVRLTREMNADTAERYSATEQAFADAAHLDMKLYAGGEVGQVANDAFSRRFLDTAGAGQENDLVDPQTRRLSRTGTERINAALLARAYGDRGLVFDVFETSDPQVKTIGAALTRAAPGWAKMREAAAAGELAAGADVTDHLVSAVSLIRHARERRLSLGDLVADWRDQAQMFDDGSKVSPVTEAFLRLLFKDDKFRVQRSAEAMAEGLDAVSEAAQATTPGPDLFGESHDFDAHAILDRAVQRLRGELDAEPGQRGGGDAGDGGGLPPGERAPGLLEAGGDRQGQAAGGEGGGAEPQGNAGKPGEVAPTPGRAEALIASDPELKALAADVEAAGAGLDGLPGLTPAEIEAARAAPKDPETIAEAIRAAAFCLSTGGEG